MSSRHFLRLIAVVASFALATTACLGGDAESTTDDPDVLAFDDESTTETEDESGAETSIPGDDEDESGEAGADTDEVPCEGGAFPGDDEFREAVCAAQWGQLEVLRTGGEMDETWGPRVAEAILAYVDDRDGALAELAAVTAETQAAAAGAPVPDAAVEVPAMAGDLQDCMVDVGRLIIEANVEAGFDPLEVEAWQAQVDQFDDLVTAGDLSAAEALICDLRDEIAAAVDAA